MDPSAAIQPIDAKYFMEFRADEDVWQRYTRIPDHISETHWDTYQPDGYNPFRVPTLPGHTDECTRIDIRSTGTTYAWAMWCLTLKPLNLQVEAMDLPLGKRIPRQRMVHLDLPAAIKGAGQPVNCPEYAKGSRIRNASDIVESWAMIPPSALPALPGPLIPSSYDNHLTEDAHIRRIYKETRGSWLSWIGNCSNPDSRYVSALEQMSGVTHHKGVSHIDPLLQVYRDKLGVWWIALPVKVHPGWKDQAIPAFNKTRHDLHVPADLSSALPY
ncbi:hypothetical protein I203_106113 [Kwoniella mangroviensis CBS 8507]|uniref:uncharacterized protein n=1 Tax=Kwoniella mangroviensis CBS 8507 TaxID=1296122 RepID=UPI00080D320B|nr:uncharacterized protein I203_04589 [Kwoniella mangroviensis CBS 8507]OCF66262.1 hypothetical protein I203_04589 [Kwoniella mangroviensis CBS 8507]